MKVIDLTHTITEKMPVFPGTEQPQLITVNNYDENGFRETLLKITTHTGAPTSTHLRIFTMAKQRSTACRRNNLSAKHW